MFDTQFPSSLPHRETIEQNQQKSGSTDVLNDSPYNPPISRRFMEGVCGISTTTLIKLEQDGVIHPKKIRQGGKEIITYTVKDVQAVLKRKGVKVKNKDSAEVIAIFNQKGGVGKSAFTQQISSLLSIKGRVLVVDLDSQADATSLFGINVKFADIVRADAEAEPSVLELMDWKLEGGQQVEYKRLPFEKVVKKISPTLHVLPADLDLAEVNYSLVAYPLADKIDASGNPVQGRLYILKEVIEQLKYDYDYIVMDLAPNIEMLNLAALLAANKILIPLECEAKSLRTMYRNEAVLKRLHSIHPEFQWDKILVVPNRFRQENIKFRALASLQDLYQGRNDIQLSSFVVPAGAVIDKCAESREPVFSMSMRYGKEHKSNIPQAKLFTDYFWGIIHELLDLPLDSLIFSDVELDGVEN